MTELMEKYVIDHPYDHRYHGRLVIAPRKLTDRPVRVYFADWGPVTSMMVHDPQRTLVPLHKWGGRRGSQPRLPFEYEVIGFVERRGDPHDIVAVERLQFDGSTYHTYEVDYRGHCSRGRDFKHRTEALLNLLERAGVSS